MKSVPSTVRVLSFTHTARGLRGQTGKVPPTDPKLRLEGSLGGNSTQLGYFPSVTRDAVM